MEEEIRYEPYWACEKCGTPVHKCARSCRSCGHAGNTYGTFDRYADFISVLKTRPVIITEKPKWWQFWL